MNENKEFWKDYFSYWENVIRGWCGARGKFDLEHENIVNVPKSGMTRLQMY